MTLPRDPRQPIDDEALASMVRDAATEWTMPPVRLDQPGWRERVRTPRARRMATTRGWLARLGQAAAGALVLTLAATVVGVWLTSPRTAGKPSEQPSASAATRSPQPGPSPLPKLLVAGDVPTPSDLIVNMGTSFATVDLAHGTIRNAIATGHFGSIFGRAVDGSFYCLCLTADRVQNSVFTHLALNIERFDATGNARGSAVVLEKTGAFDPRPETVREDAQPVSMHISRANVPGFAVVGWSARAGIPETPVWHSGLVVVRLATGEVVSQIALPDAGIGEGTTGAAVDAPRLIGSMNGKAAIARGTYSWAPIGAGNPTYHFGTDAFLVTIAAQGDLGPPEPLAAAKECGENVAGVGSLAGGRAWVACSSSDTGSLILRRIASDGSIEESRLPGGADFGGDETLVTTVSPDGQSLFNWNPMTLTLTRVDLSTGEVATTTASVAASGLDPLAAIGRWLAPSAAAKILLSAGIAISPDGTRIYAIGVDPAGASGDGAGGSRGVFVFDAATVRQVGHWDATADFVSLAVSPDGRFVYVAGSPGVDAAGRRQENQPASITVFDSTDGTVRLIAGQLAHDFMLFPSTVAG